MKYIEVKKFSEIDLNDPFFDSLKRDYSDFPEWFKRKAKEGAKAFILNRDDGSLQAFLYLKEEDTVNDVYPPLPNGKKIKIGTFKVDPHGTRLGERFLKIAIDYAYENNARCLYVTTYKEKHPQLVKLFEEFGLKYYGSKGQESVFVKEMFKLEGNLTERYPLVEIKDETKIYVLGIYPEYHTRLFPDSKLKTENSDEIIRDISHTNGIFKNYIAKIHGLQKLKPGDVLVIYRTKDKGRQSARYSSVLTSLCVVLEKKHQDEFRDFSDFYIYCKPYSVFTRNELMYQYKTGDKKVVRMTYNVAFKKRLIKEYIEKNFGIPNYWGFFEIPKEFLKQIIIDANVDERLIIGL
ncbi:N-acetyltransferase [Nitrosophilus labii]|uniref:N-acetyltransferase n=1 Tax=Nitrosophilus labii TaxID=2706014 RepID=UPI0016570393|nr:N-acetyltransferase [Nitrosophilus labii]